MRARHREEGQRGPIDRTGPFTLACVAVLLVVAAVMALLS
jgi:hypothetical protein